MIDYELEGKIAVVTGGGSGIGLATTQALAAQGAQVVVGDLDPAGAEGAAAHLVTVDFRDGDAGDRLIAAATENFGGVDIVVNNVGIAPYRESFLSVSDDDWRNVLGINFMSVVRTSRAAIPSMVERGGGAIVSIASDVARQPDPFFVDYAVSKAAIVNLSKAISIEFGPKGVRANSIAPGPTMTPLMGSFLDSLAADVGIEREAAPDYFAKDMRNLPLGKMNTPEDVAAVALFLVSPLSRQVTGSVYAVDAGSMLAT
jgi:NAD(P)-dependent dehydrogenase (short-subunit alcohol dehydrogenase family)